MSLSSMLQYRVVITRDSETGSVVAEVPALGIADQGADVPEALANIKAMVAFHVKCLQEEGEPIPPGEEGEEGFYVHVKLPAHAA
ncbi:MAG: type II toxin-antitoxin system HicB family antitoxin [candidate division NC10 bacterium]|nr:type II toxin-antitoxin system HicB family antitoxin [candidate division NC10 bacterium]MDE2322442.1 type II toxin-antitoxin system HicB family antitoxin [candidate division NC10 bacterium]